MFVDQESLILVMWKAIVLKSVVGQRFSSSKGCYCLIIFLVASSMEQQSVVLYGVSDGLSFWGKGRF